MSDVDSHLVEEAVPHYTELRPVLKGSFALSRSSIPYFIGTVPLEDVVKDLDLIENLPADLTSNWRLEELFQREIDWGRVNSEIVSGYLKLPEKLMFFNSITVALVPIDSDRRIVESYNDVKKAPEPDPKYSTAPWEVIDVGGVQVIQSSSTPHGYIRWDPKQIYAATIDGQHRLAALQTLMGGAGLNSAQLKTQVSVIYLIMDQRVGFNIDEIHVSEDQHLILSVIRQIFIDLNQYSVPVNRSRQILLNDHEIESRCLRALLCKRMGEKSEEALPLGLIHWQHGVTAKFNSGEVTAPFITTVELLYLVVSNILDLKPPKDPEDPKQVKKFVKSIEASVNLPQHMATHKDHYPGLPPLMSYVEQHHLKQGFEVPFVSPNSQYLRAIEDAFREVWQPLIVSTLLQFKPYREFIQEVDSRGGIDGELGHFLVLPLRAQIQQGRAWGQKFRQKITEPCIQLAALKKESWPFFAVFQKAIFQCLKPCWAHFDLVHKHKDKFLDEWLLFLNELYDNGLLDVKAALGKKKDGDLWWGISLNAGNTIRWNNQATERIGALLGVWWWFRFAKLKRAKTFVTKCLEERKASKYPQCKTYLEKLLKGLFMFFKKQLDHSDKPDDELKKMALDRLIILVGLATKRSLAADEAAEDDTSGEDGEDSDSNESAELPADTAASLDDNNEDADDD